VGHKNAPEFFVMYTTTEGGACPQQALGICLFINIIVCYSSHPLTTILNK